MLRSDSTSVLDHLVTSQIASRRLYQWGISTTVIIGLWFVQKNRWELDIQTISGLIILTLSSWPALLWAKRRQTWFPTFEMGILTCIPFYAIPLLNHHQELLFYPENVITKASGLVIIYIITAFFFFSISKRNLHLPTRITESIIPHNLYRFIPAGILLSNIYLFITNFTSLAPPEFIRALGSLFFSIGILSNFILARLWGAGLMNSSQKLLFSTNIIIQIALLFSSLYLIYGISFFTLTVISYSTSRRSIPWVPVLISLFIISTLHLGKGEMRQQYWRDNARQTGVKITELPSFFNEWIGYGLQARRIEKITHIKKNKIIDRASLIHMLCLSVDRIPRERPYLLGASYTDIPKVLVPRFFWKNKPMAIVSTHRLGVYLGRVSIESISEFSIAFGMLAEAYINFGYAGVVLLAALFGTGLSYLARASAQASQFSVIGILSIIATAWCLQAEQTAATWISSLFQTTIVTIGIPFAFQVLVARSNRSQLSTNS